MNGKGGKKNGRVKKNHILNLRGRTTGWLELEQMIRRQAFPVQSYKHGLHPVEGLLNRTRRRWYRFSRSEAWSLRLAEMHPTREGAHGCVGAAAKPIFCPVSETSLTRSQQAGCDLGPSGSGDGAKHLGWQKARWNLATPGQRGVCFLFLLSSWPW